MTVLLDAREFKQAFANTRDAAPVLLKWVHHYDELRGESVRIGEMANVMTDYWKNVARSADSIQRDGKIEPTVEVLNVLEDEPTFTNAVDVANVLKRLRDHWKKWRIETDRILIVAIEMSSRWKQAALLADQLRRENKLDPWAVGDAVFPEIAALKKFFADIDQRLEVPVPGSSVKHYAEYQAAREDAAKTIDYFSQWPRTDRAREEQAFQDYLSGNSTTVLEIADDLCH